MIKEWHDRRIQAGTEWDRAISENLEDAAIILLLVSADFLASPYCRDVEIAQSMERHEAGTARVIPVILRPVQWHAAPFGKLQALPKYGKPVTTWKNRDEAFADIARGIHEAVLSLTSPPASIRRRLSKTTFGSARRDIEDLLRVHAIEAIVEQVRFLLRRVPDPTRCGPWCLALQYLRGPEAKALLTELRDQPDYHSYVQREAAKALDARND